MPVVIALAVVIGVCLVGISYLVWQKKRVKAFRQYKQLYVDSRNWRSVPAFSRCIGFTI